MEKPLFSQSIAHMRSVVLCVYSGVFDGPGMLLQSGRGCEGRDQRERGGGSVEFEGCGGGG